jgi:uncharacterized membrane protein YjdF
MAFTLAYLVAAVAAAVARGNREFLFYIVTMVALIAAAAAAHRRVGFTPGVLWALSIWGLLHMAGGLVPVPASWPINGAIRVLYSWWIIPDRLKYDQVVHAYGFGVTTFVCWQGLQAMFRDLVPHPVRPSLGMLTLCAAAAIGFGALNEVIEFTATLLVEETNVGDYTNTGWDLVSNALGAVAAAALIRFRAK